jgi:hypothetical protein
MANYPQELAQDAMCQIHTGHMTGLWFLPTRPLRLNTNAYICMYVCMYIYIYMRPSVGEKYLYTLATVPTGITSLIFNTYKVA